MAAWEREGVETNRVDNGGRFAAQEGLQYAGTDVDDAFGTLVQWLHARIPLTRGAAAVQNRRRMRA